MAASSEPALPYLGQTFHQRIAIVRRSKHDDAHPVQISALQADLHRVACTEHAW